MGVSYLFFNFVKKIINKKSLFYKNKYNIEQMLIPETLQSNKFILLLCLQTD
jgi:hypothetical protein